MNQLSVVPLQHCGFHARISLWLVAGLLCAPSLGFAGKLEHTRSVTGNRDSDKHSSSHDDDDDDSGDSDSDSSDSAWTCLIPFILPFCIAGEALKNKDGDRSRPDPDVGFAPYPYAEDQNGRLVTDPEAAAGPPPPAPAPEPTTVPSGFENEDGLIVSETENPYGFPYAKAAGRLYAQYYYDIDKIHVPGLYFAIEASSRIGFETEWRLYLEPLGNQVDKMGMGTMDMSVRVIQEQAVEAHLGLGGRLMIAPDVTGGFDSSFSLLMYPINPLVGELILRIGNLGRALYLEGRASLGVTFRHGSLFVGYQGTLIQGKGDGVIFHGPTTGINLWF